MDFLEILLELTQQEDGNSSLTMNQVKGLLLRDPETWENPLQFQPERFLRDAGKGDYQGNNFNFLPFGSGRRICPGIPLGEKMVLYVLASLLHSFDWKLPEGSQIDLTDKFGLALNKQEPLIAIPIAKLSSSQHYY
ncbi:hypothetical protein JRO89_XS11G0161600 [Xanthoceras sorbifolium]|uniref:Cytochrome P450 n=1 Tax=Xanthoceras sorbifolium TaxID=99658 RepID=A0ABQ8HFS4_9ROSI|nr:hypothetical protein JRO89_XS11G0161600 [Xanthoceras sorbifolium]